MIDIVQPAGRTGTPEILRSKAGQCENIKRWLEITTEISFETSSHGFRYVALHAAAADHVRLVELKAGRSVCSAS